MEEGQTMKMIGFLRCSLNKEHQKLANWDASLQSLTKHIWKNTDEIIFPPSKTGFLRMEHGGSVLAW